MKGFRCLLLTMVTAWTLHLGENKKISQRFLLFDLLSGGLTGGIPVGVTGTLLKIECHRCKCENKCTAEFLLGGNEIDVCGRATWQSINCTDVHYTLNPTTVVTQPTPITTSDAHIKLNPSTVVTMPPPTAISEKITSGSTSPPSRTLDPIQETFCLNMNSFQCGTSVTPICASDKTFYLNKCEYSKALCADQTLTQMDISFCASG